MGDIVTELAGAITVMQTQTAPVPTTMAGIVALFGGTGATARALGVTQRTVQRWAKAERGEGGQTRRPNKVHEATIRTQAQRAARGKLGDEILKRGLKAHAVGEYVVSPGGKKETTDERDKTEYISPDDETLAEMVVAMEKGDWEEASAAFTEAFMDAYEMGPTAMFGDISLSLSIGD